MSVPCNCFSNLGSSSGVERCVTIGGTQTCSEIRIIEGACQCCKRLQVFAMGLFRHQHREEYIHRFRVNGIKFNGLVKCYQGAQGGGAAVDATMRNGNAVSDARRAEFFACDQPTKKFVGVDSRYVLGNSGSKNFQHAFFANALNAAQGAAGGDEVLYLHSG